MSHPLPTIRFKYSVACCFLVSSAETTRFGASGGTGGGMPGNDPLIALAADATVSRSLVSLLASFSVFLDIIAATWISKLPLP